MAHWNLKYEEEYIFNTQGQKLFTCRWLPVEQEPKALVFLCHGYAMESNTCMKGVGNRLASAGYAAYSMDYKGHGKSYGLLGYIDSFDDIVTDFDHYVTYIVNKQAEKKSELKGKKKYLLGESAGGAVALLLHRRQPTYWDGAVLVAPLCKIAEEMMPNRMVLQVMKLLTKIIPTWRILPMPQDIVELAFRDPHIRKEIKENPYCYKGRPRLKTIMELGGVALEIEKSLSQVSLPFMVAHGGEDKVTDISASKLLFKLAASKDKKFKMYPGMWHSLTYGEYAGNIDIVVLDIIAWLDERSVVTINHQTNLESIH